MMQRHPAEPALMDFPLWNRPLARPIMPIALVLLIAVNGCTDQAQPPPTSEASPSAQEGPQVMNVAEVRIDSTCGADPDPLNVDPDSITHVRFINESGHPVRLTFSPFVHGNRAQGSFPLSPQGPNSRKELAVDPSTPPDSYPFFVTGPQCPSRLMAPPPRIRIRE